MIGLDCLKPTVHHGWPCAYNIVKALGLQILTVWFQKPVGFDHYMTLHDWAVKLHCLGCESQTPDSLVSAEPPRPLDFFELNHLSCKTRHNFHQFNWLSKFIAWIVW